MYPPASVQRLGQARLADMHHQAERDALARAARRARRHRPRHRVPDRLTVVTGWGRHRGSAPECL